MLPRRNLTEGGEKAAFTVNEFCDRYAVSRSLFYAEVRAGRLKTRKAGRRTLILLKDASVWEEALPEGGKAEEAQDSVGAPRS